MKYTKTLFVSSLFQLNDLKPGQWVSFDSGNRGQYMGTTKSGCQIIRYQNGKFGNKSDTESNYLLRQYAKINGSV